MIKFHLKIRHHWKILNTTTNNKAIITIYCDKSYVNVVLLQTSYVLNSPFVALRCCETIKCRLLRREVKDAGAVAEQWVTTYLLMMREKEGRLLPGRS